MGKWKTCTIADLGTVVGGATPSTKNTANYDGGNISWITPKDLAGFSGRFISQGERNITEQGLNSCSTQLMPAHTVLFSSRAPIGYVAIAEKEVCTNQGFKSVIPNENTDYMFLYYLLKYNKENIEHLGSGTTFKEVSGNTMRGVEVVVPESLAEQKKIASILSDLDSKIETNRAINDNLLQQAQVIFMHKFGDNTSVTSATIADIALNVTDGVHNTVKDDPEGQYLLLSCKNIKGGLLSIGASERKINSETFEKLRRRTKLAKGDILISSVGTVGELLLLNTDPKNYEFQRSVAIVKPNPELVSSAYVYESLVAKKAELINAAHGAVQQCLFISDIAGFPIGIPNPAELRSFDEVVNPMFDTITANEAENLRLETLRDTLLPKLMSGELDVSDLDL